MVSMRQPAFIAGAIFALFLTACGGGGIVRTITVPVTPVPQPVVPAQTPFTQTLNGPAAASFALPAIGGYSGTVSLNGVIPGGTAFAVTLTDVTPATVVPLSHSRRLKEVLATQVLAYVGLQFNNGLNLTSSPAFTIQIPPALVLPGTNYYVAMFDPLRPSLGWQIGFAGPSTPSGTTLTFTPPASYALAGGQVYWFGLYVANPGTPPTAAPSIAPNPTPTPAPTATPTPTPTPTPAPLLVSSGTVNVPGIGASAAQTFNATESGYAGSITATSSNTLIATVSPASGSGPSQTFTVTGVAGGSCFITVQDGNGQSKTVTVNVATGIIVIQGRQK